MIQQQAAAVSTRNRAIFGIRAYTVAAVAASLGLTWMFASLAEQFFSGRPADAVVPPVPAQAAPVQKAPVVIQKTVHKTGYPPGYNPPRPPGTAPAPAAPAAPPACHSTPSKPC